MEQNKSTDEISSDQLREDEKIKPFGHSRASKKYVPHFNHFPRPAEIDPYVLIHGQIETHLREVRVFHFDGTAVTILSVNWRMHCTS